MQLVEADAFAACGAIQSDRERNEAERQMTLPYRGCHKPLPFLFTITQTFFMGFVVHAQAPERTVQDQVLHSRSLPAADLAFDPQFKYAGAQRFELYGVADAEQHFFVDANAGHEIQRLYWVQFE